MSTTKLFLALGLCIAAGAGEARADEVLTRALKACLSMMVHARADATWRWNEGAPGTQPPSGRGANRVCARDAWSPHVTAMGTVASKEMAIRKIPVDGSDNSFLGASCFGAEAQALFEAMARYVVSQDQRRWSSGDVIMHRNVGEGLECMRRVRGADDSEANNYWCSLVLRGLSSNFVKALDL